MIHDVDPPSCVDSFFSTPYFVVYPLAHIFLWISCGYPHHFPHHVDKHRSFVDNFFRSVPIISKKSPVFKAFFGFGFSWEMQFVHSIPAVCYTLIHNILWLPWRI